MRHFDTMLPDYIEKQIQEDMGDIFFHSVARWDDSDRLAVVFASATGGAAYSLDALNNERNFKFMPNTLGVYYERNRARGTLQATESAIASKEISLNDLPEVNKARERAAEAYRKIYSGRGPGLNS